jgi:hypothetical protein
MTALLAGPTLAFIRHRQHQAYVTSTNCCSLCVLLASPVNSSAKHQGNELACHTLSSIPGHRQRHPMALSLNLSQ